MERLTNSEQLKIHTHDAHIQLEQTLIPLIKRVDTRSNYAELLKIFYAFYAPLEVQLSFISGMENLTAGLQLRKAASLKNDIMALGASINHLRLCNNLPRCTDLTRAFGIMYVLEGSTLGGKAIANMITKKLSTDMSLPFSFFLHYGDDAGLMWHQFKTRLNSTENLLKHDLVSSATETFILFKNWIDKNEQFPALS